jgi:hypothetical protein
LIQGTVYATVFFSIVACAFLVFLVERGTIDPVLRLWLSKFPEQIEPAETAAPAPPAPGSPTFTDVSLGLPAPVADLHEPNPITDLDAPDSREPEAP